MTSRLNVEANSLAARPGIGLKACHVDEILETRPAAGFFEVHTENYMGGGGVPHHHLEAIAAQYPLSFHGVAMSLGTDGPLDARHLARTRALVDRYRPARVSEHLAWSALDGVSLNDLLPLSLTPETLKVVCGNVNAMQDTIGCQILIENPSSYLAFEQSTISEPEFLFEVSDRTGCGILLDINNVYVSAWNLNFDARAYLDAIPSDLVGEVHLAGHAVNNVEGVSIRIDDHGSPVSEPVWELYNYFLRASGPVPTLIEWDTDVPALDVLLGEADKANAHLREVLHASAA